MPQKTLADPAGPDVPRLEREIGKALRIAD